MSPLLHGCVALLALWVFVTGLFPNAPKLTGTAPARAREPDAPRTRVVFVVIDALRADFVAHLSGIHQHAVALECIASSPTVTLPRLVSLVTGSEPSFARALSNFGGRASIEDEDSLLWQWHRNRGARVRFFGDDTWLRLFPTMLDAASEGVSSFFVHDTVEVDANVTRHLDRELRSDADWDVLVLHYLGLDHAGHSLGPQHPVLFAKLRQMDALLLRLYAALRPADVLVVVGDHGMTSSGNHGGNSRDEVSTLALFASPALRPPLQPPTLIRHRCHQSDVAATLAELSRVSAPLNCLGVPLVPVLERWPFASATEAQTLRRLQEWGRRADLSWSKSDAADARTLAQVLRRAGVGGQTELLLAGLVGLVAAALHVLRGSSRGIALVAQLALVTAALAALQVRALAVWALLLYAAAVSLTAPMRWRVLWFDLSLPQLGVSLMWLVVPFSSSLAEESHFFYFFAAQTLLALQSVDAPAVVVAAMALLRVARALNGTGDKWRHIFTCADSALPAPVVAALALLTLVAGDSPWILGPAALCVAAHSIWASYVMLAWCALALCCAAAAWGTRADTMAALSLALQLVQHRNGPCQVLPVCAAHWTLWLLRNRVDTFQLRVLGAFFASSFGYSLSIATVPLNGAYVFVSSYSAVPVFATGLVMVSSATFLVTLATRHTLSALLPELRERLVERELVWAVLGALSCAASAFLQRHHLFVWSVFGPLVLWACLQLAQNLARIAMGIAAGHFTGAN